MRGCEYVLGIMGCEQSVKFGAGKFSRVQCLFPSWFKMKG